MKILIIVGALMFTALTSVSQEITLSTLFSYLNSNNEEYVKTQLRYQKFLISKEKKADVDIFDTQIVASKNATSSMSTFVAISLFKTRGRMTCIAYVTMSNKDFNDKIAEAKREGFVLDSEMSNDQWVYKKGNDIITAEKRIISVNGKDMVRYEIDVTGI